MIGTIRLLGEKLLVTLRSASGRSDASRDRRSFVVGRVKRTAVVAGLVRQAFYVLAVGVHRIKLEVAVAFGCENDLFAVWEMVASAS